MNLKKKIKAFFSFKRRSDGGFTLVELIVVIAILAILAGVAVPSYNGYIKKARESKDQLLIAAVNEAFAGGCMEAKVELDTVTDAKVSVSEQLVFGMSSVTTDAEVSASVLDQISATFNLLFEGNFDTPFVTENVKSLDWDPEEHSFVMDHENSVASRIMLSNGKSVIVAPEVMENIQASAYADMGYAEVAAAINDLSGSSATLAQVAGGLGMMDKLTNVMLHNGLITNEKATDLANKLKLTNILSPTYGVAANEAANGLQMVTAKYLAGATEEDINYLLNNIPLTSTSDMLTGMAGEAGGTRTVSAAALQYALVEAYANGSASEGQTITYMDKVWNPDKGWWGGYDDVEVTVTVSEYLASDKAKDDPISALAAVQATDGYANYKLSEQYQKDINGFVGTMSLLGDNVGSVDGSGNVTVDGAINPGDYLANGIQGSEATEILSSVLGE